MTSGTHGSCSEKVASSKRHILWHFHFLAHKTGTTCRKATQNLPKVIHFWVVGIETITPKTRARLSASRQRSSDVGSTMRGECSRRSAWGGGGSIAMRHHADRADMSPKGQRTLHWGSESPKDDIGTSHSLPCWGVNIFRGVSVNKTFTLPLLPLQRVILSSLSGVGQNNRSFIPGSRSLPQSGIARNGGRVCFCDSRTRGNSNSTRDVFPGVTVAKSQRKLLWHTHNLFAELFSPLFPPKIAE